jgi:prepilin-type N-terminal cleavage/methylation domain-containing protein
MNKRGFTLVEVLIAIIIVGIALVSLIAANGSFTTTNGYGVELSTSEFLIEQIREMTTLAAYSDLHSFDDADYNPPKNANGEDLIDFGAFSQQITVKNVSASNFQTVVADGSTYFVKVTVTILLNSKPISSASWIRASY